MFSELIDQHFPNSLTQSCSTVVAGIVLGMVFLWKLGLIAMGMCASLNDIDAFLISSLACMPVLISAGYIRLVCNATSEMLWVACSFHLNRG